VKIHTKKKLYRRMIQELAKAGYMNQPNGMMQPRKNGAENSMRRDYYPQHLA